MWSQSAHGNQLMASNSRCFVFVWISFFLFFFAFFILFQLSGAPVKVLDRAHRIASPHTHTHFYCRQRVSSSLFISPSVNCETFYYSIDLERDSSAIHRTEPRLTRVSLYWIWFFFRWSYKVPKGLRLSFTGFETFYYSIDLERDSPAIYRTKPRLTRVWLYWIWFVFRWS